MENIKKLSQTDGHAHSFSRCVYNYRKTGPTWLEFTAMSIEDKLRLLETNMTEIIWAATLRNMEHQAITDHASIFPGARLTYDQYRIALDRSIAKTKKINPEANPVKVIPGIELSVKVRPGRDPYIDLEEVRYGIADPFKALNRMLLIVASIHEYDIKDRHYISNEGYFELLSCNIEQLAALRNDDSRRGIILVCGHPWDAALRINRKMYGQLSSADSSICKDFPSLASFELFCPDAPIKYFSEKQLEQIAALLKKHNVLPELNLLQMTSRRAEVRRNKPYHPEDRPPIVEAYLRYCIKNNLPPAISIGSDAHILDFIGAHFTRKPRLAEILEQIPHLREAIPWSYP